MRIRIIAGTGIIGILCSVLMIAVGCTAPLFRAQSPDTEEVAQIAETEEEPLLVGDFASPWQTNYLKVEGIGLVTQLDGTGSDPPPNALRDRLIKEMQTHEVKHPTTALASDDTAMVTVRGFIPPGARKGDTFDVEVRVPPRSKTTSLCRGWLMRTRLREVQLLNNTFHTGRVVGLAEGPILVDALFDTADDDVLDTRGRILGMGVVNKPRQLGLVIREDRSSVRTASLIGLAINDRFHYFERGQKSGVAKPTRDNLIELAIHPRYKNNIARYLRVVSSIAVQETVAERMTRLAFLERMLLEPSTAETAALQLEASGDEGARVLRKGVNSADPEVRFYSAEALAYLDQTEAANELFEAARTERAFRWRALTALSVMEQFTAKERLQELMSVPSAETRYGAFRALRARNPLDPLVRGETLGRQFVYHEVSTHGDPIVHFSRSKRPEIVVFGHNLRLQAPNFLFAGPNIMIKPLSLGQLQVSRFQPGEEPVREVCSTELGEVIRTIVKQGGGYTNVIAAVKEAKERGYLACRIEMDALPRAGRAYRKGEEALADGKSKRSGPRVANPIPDMFFDRLGRHGGNSTPPRPDFDMDSPKERRTKDGFLARMVSWFSE
ncbi:MAG: flagellar basal body P-ring protein FlgI [Pirellulaceae bacterium]